MNNFIPQPSTSLHQDINHNQIIFKNRENLDFQQTQFNASDYQGQSSTKSQYPNSDMNFLKSFGGQQNIFPNENNIASNKKPLQQLYDILQKFTTQNSKIDQNIFASENQDGQKQITVQLVTNNFYFPQNSQMFMNKDDNVNNMYQQHLLQQQLFAPYQQQLFQQNPNQQQQQQISYLQEQIYLPKQEYKPEVSQKIEQDRELVQQKIKEHASHLQQVQKDQQSSSNFFQNQYSSYQNLQFQQPLKQMDQQIQVKTEENAQMAQINQFFENFKSEFDQMQKNCSIDQMYSSNSAEKLIQTKKINNENNKVNLDCLNQKQGEDLPNLEKSQNKSQKVKKIKKKNFQQQFSCEETKNLFVLIIPFIQNLLVQRLDSFQYLKSYSHQHNRSLQYFNRVLQEQVETLQNQEQVDAFKKICIDILERDYVKYARNHSSFYFQALALKYQQALKLVVMNPGKFNSIKLAYRVMIDGINEGHK